MLSLSRHFFFFAYHGGLLSHNNKVHSTFQIECGDCHNKFKTVALRDKHREKEHRNSFLSFFVLFLR